MQHLKRKRRRESIHCVPANRLLLFIGYLPGIAKRTTLYGDQYNVTTLQWPITFTWPWKKKGLLLTLYRETQTAMKLKKTQTADNTGRACKFNARLQKSQKGFMDKGDDLQRHYSRFNPFCVPGMRKMHTYGLFVLSLCWASPLDALNLRLAGKDNECG